MMRKGKKLLVGLLVLVLVLTLGGLSVVAQGNSPGSNGPDNLRQTFLDKLAGALGVTVDRLQGAITQANRDTIQEGVSQGLLNQQLADRLQKRADQGLPWLFFKGPGNRAGMPGLAGVSLSAVAQALDLEPQALRRQLTQGQTLEQILQQQGVTMEELQAEILAQVKQRLDEAVSKGQLTQAQADRMLRRLQNVDLSRVLTQMEPKRIGHGKFHGRWRRPRPSDTNFPGQDGGQT